MSAPNYPVVAVGLTRDTYDGSLAVVADTVEWRGNCIVDHEGVALPWALLEDEAFRQAVKDRLQRMDAEWFADDEAPEDEYPTFFGALAAELRARAGGGDA